MVSRKNHGRLASVFFLVSLILFSGCFNKRNIPRVEELSKLGILINIPENFQELSEEMFSNIDILMLTMLEVEPFSVNPLYAYAENTGKGLIIISELKLQENFTPEVNPLNNFYTYKRNLENHLTIEEIGSEEIGGDITTLLLAIVFQEDGDDVFLFKGLSYIYPNHFYKIDLYVIYNEITEKDALDFINMFGSMRVY
jgi:hypothetical protein